MIERISELPCDVGWFTTANAVITRRLGRLFGRHRLSSLDKLVIQAIGRQLPNNAASTLDGLLTFYNYFPHFDNRRSTEFGRIGGLKFVRPPHEMRFTCNIVGVPLAYVVVRNRLDQSRPSVRADLYLSWGHLHGLMFDTKPRRVFGTSTPHPELIEIAEVQVLFDPMDKTVFATEKTDDVSSLPTWVKNLIRKEIRTEMLTPIKETERAAIVRHYGLEFPDDYLELASVTEYLDCEPDFQVNGLSRIWTYMTPQPDEYVHVLADAGEGYLCLMRGREPGVYYINHSDLIPINVGRSFREALTRAVAGELKELD